MALKASLLKGHLVHSLITKHWLPLDKTSSSGLISTSNSSCSNSVRVKRSHSSSTTYLVHGVTLLLQTCTRIGIESPPREEKLESYKALKVASFLVSFWIYVEIYLHNFCLIFARISKPSYLLQDFPT